MHRAQSMHSSCGPSRMSMPVGQTATHCAAVDAIAPALPGLPPLLCATARLATPAAIGDEQRIAIEHRALDARPGAHIGADLLAGEAAQHIGGGGEHADEDIGGRPALDGEELAGERRRVGEIEHPGAAGGDGDQQPDSMLGDSSATASRTTTAPCRAGCARCGRPAMKRSTAMNRSVHTVCGQA